MMDGIAGAYSPKDNELVQKIFLATGACQHRGKASAGIAVGNSKGIYVHKGLGRIGDVITPDLLKIYQDLEPVAAIGNIGYTKNSIPEKTNAEPIEILPKKDSKYHVVLTLDGYLVKEDDLKGELEQDYHLETRNKAEVIGALLHKYIEEDGVSFEAGKKLVDRLHGRATFALTALVHDGKETYMLALNDDRAFEPFCCGRIDYAFVAASESCAHRRLGGNIEREYDGAEMTICSEKGVETKRLREEIILPDIFQKIYFGHVGSLSGKKEIFQIRRELGWELAKYYDISDADIVTPNPDSGKGVTIGIFEGILSRLEELAFDYSKLDEGIIRVKDWKAFDNYKNLKTVYPALIKQAQAVRTFQEAVKKTRYMEVGLKFGGIDSLLHDKNVVMGDDSIVKASVSEGGSIWVVHNSGAKKLAFLISYGPMVFPSFKEWSRGIDCLNDLAVQRAFKGDNPYDKSLEEINKGVAKLILKKLPGADENWITVGYNKKSTIEKVTGPGSFQALDASYPITEEFWPDWLKKEVEKYHKCHKD